MQIKVQYHIQTIRKQRNISLRQLEYMSGVSRSQISNIETGQKDATVTTICMLAAALGVTPEQLYSYTKSP